MSDQSLTADSFFILDYTGTKLTTTEQDSNHAWDVAKIPLDVIRASLVDDDVPFQHCLGSTDDGSVEDV